MRLWRWLAAGWIRGGVLPFLLVVLLAEMMFLAPLRGIRWELAAERVSALLAGGAALAAALVCLVRWGRAERRAFLQALPLPSARLSAAEAWTDLLAVLLWGAAWPLLVPARPELAWLCLSAHLWAGAAGALASRLRSFPLGLACAAAAGAGGVLGAKALSALGGGTLEGLHHPAWALGLLGAAALAWVPVFRLRLGAPPPVGRLSATGWQDPGAWLAYRIPGLPSRGLAGFLLKGNLPFAVAAGVAVAYAGFVALGSRHLGGGFRPEPVSVLLAVGLGIPLAVGAGGAHREFLLTRPLSRGRLAATLLALGAPLVLLAPLAGLWGLSRTPDAALSEQMDQIVFWEMRRVDPLGGQPLEPGILLGRLEAALQRETGDRTLRHGDPVSRVQMQAKMRAHRVRLWVSAGLLGLLWLAGGLWLRMRQYAALEGVEAARLRGRREAALALLLLLGATGTQLPLFGFPGIPGLPAEGLALLAAGGVVLALWRLARLEAG